VSLHALAARTSLGVEINDAAIHLDALDRYEKRRLIFADCLIAAIASREKIPVATFDQDLRKFADVRVELQ
jgi:predicted nucleic acid-binding protein